MNLIPIKSKLNKLALYIGNQYSLQQLMHDKK